MNENLEINYKDRKYIAKENRLLCFDNAGKKVFDKVISPCIIGDIKIIKDKIIVLTYYYYDRNGMKIDYTPEDIKKSLGIFDLDGNLVARVEHKESLSQYTNISIKNGKLVAFDADGWDCIIDPETGKIISRKFVK